MNNNKKILKDSEIKVLLQNKTPENIEKIVDSCTSMVYKLAHKYSRKNVAGGNYRVNLDDLIQSGFYGLMKSINKFDHKLSSGKFSTYAYICIRGYMLNEMTDHWKKNNHYLFNDISLNDESGNSRNDCESHIESQYADDDIEFNVDQNSITSILEKIPERDRTCVINYYGLFNNKPQTLQSIGLNILNGYSPAAVKYIIDRSIVKLRKKSLNQLCNC